MDKKKVLGIGNALVDIIVKSENDDLLDEFSLPKGSMQLIDEYNRQKILQRLEGLCLPQASGGCAANTVHALARLGVNCGFIGKVGDDELGHFFLEDMKMDNIDPYLSLSNSNTGTAITFIGSDGERTFGTYLGAAVELYPRELTESIFTNYDYFHIEGYLLQNHDLITRGVKLARENNMVVSLDMASYNVVQANLDYLKSLIKLYVDIVFANEEEARAFTGKAPEKALGEIAEICDIAVVKMGNKGSLIQKGKEIHRIDPIKANLMDTTGAGDLYAAGFLYGLIHDLPLEKCGQIGSLVSGKVIEVLGAKMGPDKWKEIDIGLKSILAG